MLPDLTGPVTFSLTVSKPAKKPGVMGPRQLVHLGITDGTGRRTDTRQMSLYWTTPEAPTPENVWRYILGQVLSVRGFYNPAKWADAMSKSHPTQVFKRDWVTEFRYRRALYGRIYKLIQWPLFEHILNDWSGADGDLVATSQVLLKYGFIRA